MICTQTNEVISSDNRTIFDRVFAKNNKSIENSIGIYSRSGKVLFSTSKNCSKELTFTDHFSYKLIIVLVKNDISINDPNIPESSKKSIL